MRRHETAYAATIGSLVKKDDDDAGAGQEDQADCAEEQQVVERRRPDRTLRPVWLPRAQVLPHHRRRRVADAE